MKMEKLWPIIGEISRAHYLKGLADPTLGGLVAAAICGVAPIAPPRSWPDKHKTSFSRLPYDLQVYLDGHEQKRDKEIKRAQSAAAKARQDLAAITQQPKQVTDAIPKTAA